MQPKSILRSTTELHGVLVSSLGIPLQVIKRWTDRKNTDWIRINLGHKEDIILIPQYRNQRAMEVGQRPIQAKVPFFS